MEVAQRLKALRKERRWSQEELAQAAGVDQHQLSRYENGHAVPSAEALVKLAQALDVSVDYLLIEDAPRQPLRFRDPELTSRLQALAQLSKADRDALLRVIDGLLTKQRLLSLAKGEGSAA